MLVEPGIGEAPFGQRTELEIIHEYVGFFRQCREDRLPRLDREIERQRPLVAIGAEIVSRLTTNKGRSPGTGIIARPWWLNLDHLGAHVAQHHRASRPGENTREIDDQQA